MTTIVDARGKPCPQPVLMTRKALESGQPVTTVVDNETAVHNVTRMAAKAGHEVSVEQRADGTFIHIAPPQGASGVPEPETEGSHAAAPSSGPLVLTIPSDIMGRGDAGLGAILIRGFFHALGEASPLPDTILFFNAGVKLVIEGSPVLDDVKSLADRGIEVFACGTCLDYFALKDKLAVGEVTNMYAIVETMLNAAKVVSI